MRAVVRHIKVMITFRVSLHNDFIGFVFSDIGIEIKGGGASEITFNR